MFANVKDTTIRAQAAQAASDYSQADKARREQEARTLHAWVSSLLDTNRGVRS